MSLWVTSLNSGSNGNCFYIANEQEAVLVDAGISCRETERRMERLNLSMKKVRALFISHEHTDHVRGVRVLSKKYQLPVYSTPGTLKAHHFHPLFQDHRTFSPYECIQIGGLKIMGFPKNHDAHDPQSFIIQHQDTCVGIFTDIGEPCAHVIQQFKCCHAVFLETNYDARMLETGRYPYHLKRRIAGHLGHLSNEQALDLFCRYKPPFLTHLFLSHLSQENNDPDLVYSMFQAHAGGVEIVLTSRTAELPLFKISPHPLAPPKPVPVQLSLFHSQP